MINNNGFIGDWIKENSRVLDLGCGDGSLLETLTNKHQVRGYGLEIDPDSISQCIDRGVNVIEQDLNEGLENFADASFDTVVMKQTHLRTRTYPLPETFQLIRQRFHALHLPVAQWPVVIKVY